MDSDVRVINNKSMNVASSDLSVEILEPEVIELDTSCDAIISDNESSIYNEKNIVSFPDNVEITETVFRSERGNSIRSDISSQPVFKVMFRDENISRQYRRQVKNFLQVLLRTKPTCNKETNESNLILEIWDNDADSRDGEIDSKDEILLVQNNKENENDLIDNVQCNDSLFTIDKQPNIKNDLDIPTYGQKYESLFEESNNETPKDFTPKLNCFNCNGNHNLRDCLLPKNQSNINKNRKEFATKYNAGMRYHASEDQRFSHMIPGQLSQKLRKALGLKDNQLPKHIYRMRLLGYPPGWLEEARLQYSGLSLFNSDGIAESDINQEEGEIITNADRDQYDIKKIHDFPGFNVPPPPGTIDDNHKYWTPQMQHIYSKQMMLMNLQGKVADDGYKRKKLKLCTPVINIGTISDMEIEDMEAENVVENVPINGHFIPPLPKEPAQMPPVPPPPEQPQTDDSDSQSQELPSFDFADDTISITNSPSLSELERTKKVLLMEIEETNSQSNSNSLSTKNDSNATFVSETPFANLTASTSKESVIQDSMKSDLQSCPDTSFKNDFNTTLDMSDKIPNFNSTPIRSISQRSSDQASLSVHLGTPIIPSTSPYSKLPSSEKFSKDISDVINFENLPDSTGKYEQMSEVLQKVRDTMAKLHKQE